VRKQKCILTYARSWIALAATRCLGKHGIYVITGDTERGAAANFSRYSKEHFVYPDPAADPDGFVDRLVDIAKSHTDVDTDLVLMPMYTEIYPVLCRQDRFEGLVKMVLPPKEAYELVRNKAELAAHCNKFGIRIPSTVVSGNADEFYSGARNMEYPAFVKVPAGSGSLGIRKAACYDEAVKTFDEMVLRYKITDPRQFPILQACAGGTDHCSAFLFDHGEFRAAMTYRNVVDFPKGKGVGALRETVDAHALEKIGRKLLEHLGWNGVCQIDFRWDGAGEPWLIEINPRFWGGLAQSIASGWVFPVWMYDLALKGRIELPHPEKSDVRTINPVLMASRMAQDLFAGRGKDIAGLIKEQRGAVNEFFSWKDPLPVLGLAYPLMVYLKHGKITPELLIGEKGMHRNE